MKLGKLSITPGFLLLAAWLYYIDEQGLFFPGMLCCVLHELGHLSALAVLKIPIKGINITVVGAEIVLGGKMSYMGELAAAAMGPAVNLILAALLCRVPGGTMLAGLNFTLGFFNLLPFGQMDGGRILSSLVCLFWGPDAGERVLGAASCLTGSIIGVAGLLLWQAGGNLSLGLTSLWLLSRISKKGVKYPRKGGNKSCQ